MEICGSFFFVHSQKNCFEINAIIGFTTRYYSLCMDLQFAVMLMVCDCVFTSCEVLSNFVQWKLDITDFNFLKVEMSWNLRIMFWISLLHFDAILEKILTNCRRSVIRQLFTSEENRTTTQKYLFHHSTVHNALHRWDSSHLKLSGWTS